MMNDNAVLELFNKKFAEVGGVWKERLFPIRVSSSFEYEELAKHSCNYGREICGYVFNPYLFRRQIIPQFERQLQLVCRGLTTFTDLNLLGLDWELVLSKKYTAENSDISDVLGDYVSNQLNHHSISKVLDEFIFSASEVAVMCFIETAADKNPKFKEIQETLNISAVRDLIPSKEVLSMFMKALEAMSFGITPESWSTAEILHSLYGVAPYRTHLAPIAVGQKGFYVGRQRNIGAWLLKEISVLAALESKRDITFELRSALMPLSMINQLFGFSVSSYKELIDLVGVSGMVDWTVKDLNALHELSFRFTLAGYCYWKLNGCLSVSGKQSEFDQLCKEIPQMSRKQLKDELVSLTEEFAERSVKAAPAFSYDEEF